jgi:hypothetical protein
MSKWLLGIGIAVVAMGLVVGGAVFAAYQTPDLSAGVGSANPPFSPGGMMGSRGPAGSEVGRTGGPLHDYMIQALAAGLDLSAEDLEAKLASGDSLQTIAEARGVKADDLPGVIDKAKSKALASAVEDGVLTQAQADWLQQHPLRATLGRMREMMGRWGFGRRTRMLWGGLGWR